MGFAPTATPIPDDFQPTDRNTKLQYRAYLPTPAASWGPSPWPSVIVIHGGGFRSGHPFQGGPDQAAVSLAQAGYYVRNVDYELAPCALLPIGQACHDNTSAGQASGRPPQQTDDIKAQIRALRADPACNGNIGILGGSAGGSHAVFCAIDKTATANHWPHWCENGADDRPDCAVSLSGGYDFSDRTPESYDTDGSVLLAFINDVENYTHTGDLGIQRSYSPVGLTILANDFKPLFLINSIHDTMPYHQIVDMICALEAAGLAEPDDYQTLTITNDNSSEHEFGYWDSWDGQPCIGPCKSISADVIAFLDAHLK